MFRYLLLGSGLAFAAAVQPGPLQAYLLAQVAARGWKHTLPASFAPLLSDGPIAALALLVLGRLSGLMQQSLRAAGGLLLLFLAWTAYRQWKRPAQASALDRTAVPRTLLEATFVNLLNPNPYLGWTLILGPTAVMAWRQGPGLAATFIAAFYVTMVITLAALIFVFGSARFLGSRFQRALLLISAIALAGIAVSQLATSLPRIVTALPF
ncbi:MAG: LysE family translocator [Acidobacteria bacterium]|jgi:threonine/homoserine/homoserine lactone efflux protein|nr:LysE family translocator [Acidobacteriota bacterium]